MCFSGHFIGVADRVSIEFSFWDFGFKPALLIVPNFNFSLGNGKRVAAIMLSKAVLGVFVWFNLQAHHAKSRLRGNIIICCCNFQQRLEDRAEASYGLCP